MQRSRLRESGLLAIPIVIAVVVEVVALRLGSTGQLILGVLAALVAISVIISFDMGSVGVLAACLCALTLTWNGWHVGGIKPGDALIFGTLLCFLLAGTTGEAGPRLPWWIKTLAFGIFGVAMLHVMFPMSDTYIDQRIVFTGKGKPAPHLLDLPSSNLHVAFQFIVAIALVPLIFALAARRDKRAPYWLGLAFAIGAAASGWAAGIDRVTHIGISRIITGVAGPGSRQIGFAGQPNYLAAGLVLAIPFAVWLLFSAKKLDRFISGFALVGMVFGVYASGSRGGAVSAVLALGVSILSVPRARRYTIATTLAGIGFIAVIVAVLPGFGRSILRSVRLIGGGASTAGSDIQRSLAATQGHHDFFHSPFYGVGLQASFDASQVYLQELASGGLLLFICMQIYMAGWVLTGYKMSARFHLAGAIAASAIAALALNFFEADLTDRFYYVPAGILVSLMYAAAHGYTSEEQDGPPPAPPAALHHEHRLTPVPLCRALPAARTPA